MSNSQYIIVGDDYKSFAQQTGVFTVSHFYQHMLEDQAWPETGAKVILGLGIGYNDRDFIASALAKRDVSDFRSIPPVASLQDTHKHTNENIMITQPRKLGRLLYEFDLSITDKIDRLSDHVTGKHVGAMLVMEAARQATIVVLEEAYCKATEEKFSLVLDKFESKFDAYLFPLPTTLTTSIYEIKVSPKNICVIVTSVVKQAGNEIATISLDVTLCSANTLGKIEERKSQTAVRDLLKFLETNSDKQLEEV
jgi:hypothetical protein